MIRLYLETSIDKSKVTSNEHNFLETYLSHLYPNPTDLSIEIVPVGGKDKLHLALNQFEECTLLGGKNLIVFDADGETNGGGFAVRQKELKDKFQELGVQADLFLFPNNKDEGDFESLLEGIINPEHAGLLTCFSGYDACIQSRNKPGLPVSYKTPNRKAKMYSYMDAMVKSRKKDQQFKSGNWFFDNTDYWNLEAEALLPLKNFLKENIR